LENIRDECAKTIEEKYGLKKSQLKMYFHYQVYFCWKFEGINKEKKFF